MAIKDDLNQKLITISDTIWEYMTPEILKNIINKQTDDVFSKIEAENAKAAQQNNLPKLKKLQAHFCKQHCKSPICHCHEHEEKQEMLKCSPENCDRCNSILC